LDTALVPPDVARVGIKAHNNYSHVTVATLRRQHPLDLTLPGAYERDRGGAEAVLVPEFEPDPEDLIGFLMASCWYDDECPASVEGDEK
jgi:hypothetical protein